MSEIDANMIPRRTALRTALGTLAALVAEVTPACTISGSGGDSDKQVIIATIDYVPGAGSTKHRHPRPVFAYVARGTIVSQLGTGSPITYVEGETWCEPPGSVHSTSRNASNTEPAKLVVFYVADRKDVLTIPI